MVNTEVLRQKVVDSGLKYKSIAQALGLSSYGLQLKIDGSNDFKAGEISQICEMLNITSLEEKESIFFTK